MKNYNMRPLATWLFFVLIIGDALSRTASGNAKLESSGSSQPIEINADQGIEWLSEEKVYLARGNANAKQGDLSMRADILKAFYRNTKSEKDEIYRIEANGKVLINNLIQTVSGENGIYDLDQSLIVMSGGNLQLDTGKEIVRASDSLEFWEKSGEFWKFWNSLIAASKPVLSMTIRFRSRTEESLLRIRQSKPKGSWRWAGI